MNKMFFLCTILVLTLLYFHCAVNKNINKGFYKTGELQYKYKYVDGKRNGVTKEYYPTGELKAKWIYKDGVLIDVCRGYYKTGELQYEYKHVNGKRNGVTKEYYPTGELKAEWIYKDNMLLDGCKGYHETGELQYEYKHVNGKKNGITKEYYETGELKAEWMYKNGRLVDGDKEYYKSGELKAESRTLEEINRGLLDTTTIDTTVWHTEYNIFLLRLDLTLRSKEKIDSIITHNEHYILNVLNKYELDIKENDTVNYFFFRNGELRIPVLKYTKNTDTTIGNAINKAISKIALDSIPSEKYRARGQFIFNSKKLTLLGPITYESGGGRSRASIMKVVMKYLIHLRAAYNRRLRVKNGIKGRITVKYAIDQYGRVIFIKVQSSTVNDALLEKAVVQQIKNWKFEPVFKDKDITEVIYPFIFSQ